jgi:radical SAM superfamily enzyme YgiQ (UPF0313 family)
MRILLLYPRFPDTFWGFKHALGFVNRKASSPPLGLATVAAMLPAEWEKRLVDMNVRSLRQSDLEWADYVFVSAMDLQRDSVSRVIAQCKQAGVKVVAGGPLFTSEPDAYPDVDTLVLNEAELTLPLFLQDLEQGTPQHLYTTGEFVDMQRTPIPLFSLLDREAYDSMSIQFSRGCPYHCDFCDITVLLGHRPRLKSTQQVIAELDSLYSLGWRGNVFFVDDNFIGNKRVLKSEVLPALIEWRRDKPDYTFSTEVSINLADDEELMNSMAQAGFNSLFVGIETPNAESLQECHKTQNEGRDLEESVRRMQRHGFQVMGGFIVGFDSDTPDVFRRQADFIQKTGIVAAMVGLLQAPTGTPLYERMRSEGRLRSEMSGNNTDGSTNIVPKMPWDTLISGYKSLVAEIYSPKMIYERIATFLREYQPPRIPTRIHGREVLALVRSIFVMGVRGPERLAYWKLFWGTLLHTPRKFPMAITLSIYGYHFRKVSALRAG